jgi:cell wall-associated NlpC family hydrolase
VTIALDHDKPNLVQHLGVYIGEGKFIHIMQKTGVVVTRIDHAFFKRKIRGYYRWKNS